jgi:glycosyltransferase involved in cell wall biosynthesis
MITNNVKIVSIIIPTYNRATIIVEAIDSVLNHWSDEYEILVIDDGSTDNTKDTLRSYIETNKIRYLYQPNSGKPSVARNKGIAHATGKYICFLDSDDVLFTESIAKRRKVLDTNVDVAIVFTDWIDISDSKEQQFHQASWVIGEKFLNDVPKEFIVEASNGMVKFNTSIINMIYTKEFVFTSSVMVRKTVLEELGSFDENFTISEDRDLWLRIAGKHHSVYLSEPLAYKRRHATNITNRNLSYNYRQDILAVEKFMNYSGILEGAHSRVARKQLAEFYSQKGQFFWFIGNLVEARSCLTAAVKNYSKDLSSYLFLVCTFLPRTVIKAIRTCKNIFRTIQAG